jgi:hypothetical protein
VVKKRYSVTIAPVGGGDPGVDPRFQMNVRVDVTDGEPHVVELTVRAAPGVDLTSGELPSIDLEQLAQIFAPRPSGGRTVRRATAPTARPAGRSATTDAAADKPAGPIGEVTAARAYRRMPDPADLQRVYASVGSIAGVAKHYDVPPHTAQGWIGRLRRQSAASRK